MVALAWRVVAPTDAAEPISHASRSGSVVHETASTTVGATLPADIIALESVRDDDPAMGFGAAALLSMPLWGIAIGLSIYLAAAI